MNSGDESNRRILVVDDNPTIHEDLRRVMAPPSGGDELDAEAARLFGAAGAAKAPAVFLEMHSALQGQEAVEKARSELASGRRFAAAFVDMRMPPGWDGLTTIRKLWEVDPEIRVVICTAYSDHSWDEIRAALPGRERWVVLKKPFDKIEVLQLAAALTETWNIERSLRARISALEGTPAAAS